MEVYRSKCCMLCLWLKIGFRYKIMGKMAGFEPEGLKEILIFEVNKQLFS